MLVQAHYSSKQEQLSWNYNGKVYHHKKLNNKLERICEAINKELQESDNPEIKVFPHVHNHMLRHTFATRMREAGADIKATSDMMGHEGILITLKTYTDASSEFKHREINLLQYYFDTTGLSLLYSRSS